MSAWGQGEDLRQLAALGREAAEILWEMAAMQDTGDAAKEMLDKSAQLQVRFVLALPAALLTSESPPAGMPSLAPQPSSAA